MHAQETFINAALKAGILQDCIEPLVAMNLANAKNDVNTRKVVSAFLQKEFIKNPHVLKLFYEFARELAYEFLVDLIFDTTSDIENAKNNDMDALVKVLFKD